MMQFFDTLKPVIGKATIQIEHPVEYVFIFVGEHFFDNYPKWALEVAKFSPLDGNKVFVGAKARQIRMEQGQAVESVFEVTQYEPAQVVTLAGIELPYRNTYRFASNTARDLTELEFAFELLELELFMRPFEKLIRIAIEEGAENTVLNIKNLISEYTTGANT